MNDIHWSYPEQYRIEGAGNVERHDYNYFNDLSLYPEFQSEFNKFKQILLNLKKENATPISMLRYGDGDHFFLTKQAIGSASPGRRALGKDYSQLNNHDEFVDGVCENDYILAEIFPTARNYFKSLYTREIDFPLEYIYGMIANRWFFENFKDKRIGLIGASEKLNVIEKLLGYEEYQNYIGATDFDLIHFPQKFACDDINLVEEFVANQLINSTADIYLVGISSAKLALLHRFKKYRNVSYIDVGCGIDALAGCVSSTRPYFYNWTNYRIENYNYSSIDYMNYNHSNEIILT
jgi:hypothetical protein